MTRRLRADRLLVERGLYESRARAQAAIAAGLVTANDVPVRRASDEVAFDANLKAALEHPWVSRGGVKLAAALDHFGFDPEGHVCLDVGASTGGFSEVLLARGAKRIYAVDVGTGQLHPKLKARGEIMSLEHTDIRKLDAAKLPEPPDFMVMDASFISLKLILPVALALTRRPARVLALIKPQFEVGRGRSKKGVVRDAGLHAEVCSDISSFVSSAGWIVAGIFESPISGGDGNREFFIGASRD